MIKVFLEKNQSLEDFKKLDLHPTSWSGSMVGEYTKRLMFYNVLKEVIPSGIDFILHVEEIEKRCESLENSIEHSKKRDFMDNY